MSKSLLMIAMLLPGALLPLDATAHGCLKGAAVGGVAGHLAGHHAVAGAAVGCVVGHHRAKVKEREAQKNASQARAAAKQGAPSH
ncbi:MAG TPA: hypothetical protein VME42_06620 [Steroidobacteraceae bacterium]|nr:hypothetical protein [Steroidobacteraceae bacterium]